MIKIQVFDGTDEPITFISDITIEDFFEWSNDSKLIAVPEYNTDSMFIIPITKYVTKIELLTDE